MSNDVCPANDRHMTSIFEKYLTGWVGLCIIAGILLGKIAPDLAQTLDGMAIHVGGAPVVSIPIAVCLFLRRDHSGQSADYYLDFHPALYSDRFYFWDWIRSSKTA